MDVLYNVFSALMWYTGFTTTTTDNNNDPHSVSQPPNMPTASQRNPTSSKKTVTHGGTPKGQPTPKVQPDGSVPKRILAFRTTTMVLSQLQKKLKRIEDPHQITTQEAQELKLADAFAHIAVAEHDVIAISTQRTPLQLNVLAHPEDKGTRGTSPAAVSTSCEFFYTKNNCRKEPDVDMRNGTAFPRIVNTTPVQLGGQTLENYLNELRGNWIQPNLRTHLWVVGHLMVELEAPTPKPFEVFMAHTISMCHPKMARRFDHRYSRTYYQGLDKLKIEEIPSENIQHEDGALPQYKAQYGSDHDFMTALANMDRGHPNWKLSSVIPKLILVSKKLPERGRPFFYYTKDTCKEYHQFLCLLLKQFRGYIQQLYELTHPTPDPLDKKSRREPPEIPPDIRSLVGKVFLMGYILWKMIRGRAFEIHIQNIQPLLLDPQIVLKGSSSVLPPQLDSAEAVEYEEELQATMSFTIAGKIVLWKAYRDWLLLMVVHFESTSGLRNFIRGPHYDHKPIKIKVILGTEVGDAFLPLNDLFASNFFPGDKAGNEAIRVFVEKGLSLQKPYEHCLAAFQAWDEVQGKINPNKAERAKAFDLVVSHLATMVSVDISKRHDAFVANTKQYMFQWRDHEDFPKEGTSSTDRTETPKKKKKEKKGKGKGKDKQPEEEEEIKPLPDLITAISQGFQDMVTDLSCELKEYGSIPTLQLNFRGTMHCEAYIAALTDSRTRQKLAEETGYEEILAATKDFGHVIGVSKRSCPACHHFLSLLSPEDPFITSGSHSSLTACTLPIWISEDLVGLMNSHFGKLLRDKLVQQMDEREQKRKTSIGSQDSRALSTESFHSEDGNDVPDFEDADDTPF